MYRSASTPVVTPVSRTAADELGQALNRQHRKFYANNINDESLVPMFKAWAKPNLCAENVDFFLEVASFRRACQKRGHKIDIRKEADTIFRKYISLGAPHEINISYVVRVHILRYIGEPTAKSFDEAQTHILELMEVDVFPRFFRSPEFLLRYRPVPDPLPPLRKAHGKPLQSNDTKSRSASLKSYFRRVMPSTNTRSGRSQSNIDDTLSEKVADMQGDQSPRGRSRAASIIHSDEPVRRSPITQGDESPRTRSRAASTIQGDESPRSRSRTSSIIQGDESPRSRSRNMTTTQGDESPRTRSHITADDDLSHDHLLGPTSIHSAPTSPRSPVLSSRPSSSHSQHSQKDAQAQEKERRNNSFPHRITGVFTLRSFARHSKLFQRKSGDLDDGWDDDASGWSSPAISPRLDGPDASPILSPRNASSAATTPRGSPVITATSPSSRPVTPRPNTPALATLDASAATSQASRRSSVSSASARTPHPEYIIVSPPPTSTLPNTQEKDEERKTKTSTPIISIIPPTNPLSTSPNASTTSTTSTLDSSPSSSPVTSPFTSPMTSPAPPKSTSSSEISTKATGPSQSPKIPTLELPVTSSTSSIATTSPVSPQPSELLIPSRPLQQEEEHQPQEAKLPQVKVQENLREDKLQKTTQPEKTQLQNTTREEKQQEPQAAEPIPNGRSSTKTSSSQITNATSPTAVDKSSEIRHDKIAPLELKIEIDGILSGTDLSSPSLSLSSAPSSSSINRRSLSCPPTPLPGPMEPLSLPSSPLSPVLPTSFSLPSSPLSPVSSTSLSSPCSPTFTQDGPIERRKRKVTAYPFGTRKEVDAQT